MNSRQILLVFLTMLMVVGLIFASFSLTLPEEKPEIKEEYFSSLTNLNNFIKDISPADVQNVQYDNGDYILFYWD